MLKDDLDVSMCSRLNNKLPFSYLSYVSGLRSGQQEPNVLIYWRRTIRRYMCVCELLRLYGKRSVNNLDRRASEWNPSRSLWIWSSSSTEHTPWLDFLASFVSFFSSRCHFFPEVASLYSMAFSLAFHLCFSVRMQTHSFQVSSLLKFLLWIRLCCRTHSICVHHLRKNTVLLFLIDSLPLDSTFKSCCLFHSLLLPGITFQK